MGDTTAGDDEVAALVVLGVLTAAGGVVGATTVGYVDADMARAFSGEEV